MKSTLFILFFFSFTSVASEVVAAIKFDNLSPFIPVVKLNTKQQDKFSSLLSERLRNKHYCNIMMVPPTPDKDLEYRYKSGELKNIYIFQSTSDLVSYTPIRDLVERPLRPALYEGHYYVSE